MNAQLLLNHFDRICEAPDAIPRLRRFVLDLAVRGKLVEQVSDDGMASQLIAAMSVEKSRRHKEQKRKTTVSLSETIEYPEPFSIPATWAWCRLSDVGTIVGGGTPPSADSDNFAPGGTATHWLTPADLGKQRSSEIQHGARDLTQQGLRLSSATVMPAGSVLFTSRAPIGYVAIASNPVTTNQGFKSVVPYLMPSNQYVAIYLRAFGPYIDSRASGTTFKEVSGRVVANLPFPLPPLAEQHRIVAKVDELTHLWDELTVAHAEREKRRDWLSANSLQRLNEPSSDATTFRADASLYMEHLSRTAVRVEHIHELRKTIRNLAVRGKLVRQMASDEPAANLLQRLAQERDLLAKQQSLRFPRNGVGVEQSRLPFQVPGSWQWAGIGDVALAIDYGTSEKADSEACEIPVYRMGNIQSGRVTDANLKYVDRTIEDLPRLYLKCNDILFNRTNSHELVGKTGIFKGDDDTATFASYLIRIRLPAKHLEAQYFNLAMNSGYFRETQIEPEITQQCGQANFNGTKLAATLVPVPPLAEQRRIVAKLDELMALCDRLQARIQAGRDVSSKLLEAVMSELLAHS